MEWGSKPTRENMFGGNLAGIEDKLEYIAGLGVNAIYLCPIFKSNSNHRYHTVDYFEIDPVLGTLCLRRLENSSISLEFALFPAVR